MGTTKELEELKQSNEKMKELHNKTLKIVQQQSEIVKEKELQIKHQAAMASEMSANAKKFDKMIKDQDAKLVTALEAEKKKSEAFKKLYQVAVQKLRDHECAQLKMLQQKELEMQQVKTTTPKRDTAVKFEAT